MKNHYVALIILTNIFLILFSISFSIESLPLGLFASFGGIFNFGFMIAWIDRLDTEQLKAELKQNREKIECHLQ